ncbi:MAG: hypothetical protein K9H49_14705 [Bacteroidales bacterium]|nr:hypothetical protein [Bacteroidales bacterium]MCF8390551.1 hypothetical protein [Bacteroidales bacterium]
MGSYNSYHTTLKQLAKKDRLPGAYKNELDRTTLWRWKQEPLKKYIGNELSNIEVLEEFINKSEAQKLMKSYLKVTYTLINMLNIGRQFHYILKQNRSIFIKTILKYKKDIDIKLVLRLCKIPLSVFYSWKNRVLMKCDASPLMICKKTYPNQLTSLEVSTMKNLLLNERFKFWPICSIAYYALREKLLSVSLATWYLYHKKLGIARPLIPKKKKHSIGIRASLPNQVWHADITIVKTQDNIKHYVYLLMDNFSKYILNFRVEAFVSGKVRMETIRETYNKHIMNSQEVSLIVDGGSENNNSEINELTNNNTIRLNKIIALKDIPFSNSLIEAQNKLLKYRYLFRQEYSNIE